MPGEAAECTLDEVFAHRTLWRERIGRAVPVPPAAPALDEAGLAWLPPIARPPKLVCIGTNYTDHIAEMAVPGMPHLPYAFLKPATTLAGSGATVALPGQARMVDWEAELAVVIGRRVRDVQGEAAMAAVAGCAVLNDVSARDWIADPPSLGIGFHGVSLWLPQTVRQLSDLSSFMVGLLTALPFVGAAAAMVLNGCHADRAGERRWHVILSCLLGAAGFVIGALASSPVVAFLGVGVGAVGIWGSIGVFWSLPMTFLGGTAAAAGIALVNPLGNVGGPVGPYLIGWLRARTPDFGASLLLIAGFLVLGCMLVAALQRDGAVAPASRSLPT